MKQIRIGNVNLFIPKPLLLHVCETIYIRFYKKERLKHLTSNDKRLPRLKITDDIFSLSIWFKDRTGSEHHFFLDGTVLPDFLHISSLTFSENQLSENEYTAYLDVLCELTEQASGCILFTNNGKAGRIQKGSFDNTKKLIHELYLCIPENKRHEIDEIYQYLVNPPKN